MNLNLLRVLNAKEPNYSLIWKNTAALAYEEGISTKLKPHFEKLMKCSYKITIRKLVY